MSKRQLVNLTITELKNDTIEIGVPIQGESSLQYDVTNQLCETAQLPIKPAQQYALVVPAQQFGQQMCPNLSQQQIWEQPNTVPVQATSMFVNPENLQNVASAVPPLTAPLQQPVNMFVNPGDAQGAAAAVPLLPSQSQSTQWPAHTITGNPECGFCKRNGETYSIYTGHNLKDEDGKVICPILFKYVCPICKATGHHAHTMRYCPVNRRQQYDNPLTRCLRNSSGLIPQKYLQEK